MDTKGLVLPLSVHRNECPQASRKTALAPARPRTCAAPALTEATCLGFLCDTGGMDEDSPQASGADPAEEIATQDSGPDVEEVKRQFRAALDRKKATHASESAAQGRNTGKVQSSHGPATSRRSFRRKSG